jgi:hypothetical protein
MAESVRRFETRNRSGIKETVGMVKTSEVLAAFREYNEPLHFRAFKPKKAADTAENRPQMWTTTLFDLSQNSALQKELRTKNQHCGIYFVVNAGGDTDASITRYTAWFVENDSLTIEDQHKKLDASPLLPSIRNETKKSVHAFWLVGGDCSKDQWIDVQSSRLIPFFNGDPKIKNPARVMRVPGFDHLHLNGNGLEKKKVTVHTFEPSRRYTLAQMLEAFPAPPPENVAHGEQALTSGPFEYHEDRHAELCQRIMSRGKRNSKGKWDARAICHGGKEHPQARLIVVDTLKRVRPVEHLKERIYNTDYDAVGPLGDLARKYGVAVVVIHHTRKMYSPDPLDLVSGSLGLTGAADGVLVLKRARGEADATLHATGRDYEDKEIALKFDKEIKRLWVGPCLAMPLSTNLATSVKRFWP